MTQLETVRFHLNRYNLDPRYFENEFVAQLPGLIITQFPLDEGQSPGQGADRLALRFDFVDDWYSVVAFLDGVKRPTGHYLIAIQTPLISDGGTWKGSELVLGMEVLPERGYLVTGEEGFCAAVEDGWMRVYAAANAREAMRKLCHMLDEGRLPQEVMDAVWG